MEKPKGEFKALIIEVQKLRRINADMIEALQYYEKGVNHFYDSINFGASNLDAEAIDYMNTVGIKIRQSMQQATA